MISTVLCGRFYKIFVSPMLHRKTSRKNGWFFCAASCAHPRASRCPFPTQKSQSRSMWLWNHWKAHWDALRAKFVGRSIEIRHRGA